MPDSLRPRGLQPTRPLCSWGSPGEDTGVPSPGVRDEQIWGTGVTTFQKEMSQGRACRGSQQETLQSEVVIL